MHLVRLVAGAAVLLFAFAPIPAAQTATLVLENARVIVGDGTAPLERGTLVARNGRIEALGPAGKVAVPERPQAG